MIGGIGKDSSISRVNQRLKAYDRWTAETIEDRQQVLIDLARHNLANSAIERKPALNSAKGRDRARGMCSMRGRVMKRIAVCTAASAPETGEENKCCRDRRSDIGSGSTAANSRTDRAAPSREPRLLPPRGCVPASLNRPDRSTRMLSFVAIIFGCVSAYPAYDRSQARGTRAIPSRQRSAIESRNHGSSSST